MSWTLHTGRRAAQHQDTRSSDQRVRPAMPSDEPSGASPAPAVPPAQEGPALPGRTEPLIAFWMKISHR